LIKAFETHGAVPRPSSPQEFQSFLTADIAQNRKAIEAAGIQPE
jgi:tripartite-type tricarboxylate transporter receptor subunit TctC